jgi:hypothetical protein
MMVCVPVTADGQVDPHWGRAGRVAVADVADGQIRDWQEFAGAGMGCTAKGPRVPITPGSHGSCGTTRSRRSPSAMWGPACSACSARWPYE